MHSDHSFCKPPPHKTGICTLYKIWQDVNLSDESTFAALDVLKVASCIFVRLLEAADTNVACFGFFFNNRVTACVLICGCFHVGDGVTK